MSIRANVDARRLNERVRFERNTPIQSGSGDMVESWAPIGPRQCWAAVDGEKAFRPEPEFGSSTQTKRDYTIWVRADIIVRFNITPVDRVVWKGRILNIKDVQDQQLRGRLMALICIAGMNAG